MEIRRGETCTTRSTDRGLRPRNQRGRLARSARPRYRGSSAARTLCAIRSTLGTTSSSSEGLYGIRTSSARLSALGLDIGKQHRGGGSDGNFTGAMGIPTLDGLGVRGADAHTLNEHIIVDSLAERGRLMAGLLATLE